MNIFVTDSDPVIAAQNLDNKRVVKMILESAQMLCTALHCHGASHYAQYKKTHENHPSNVWVRQTDSNYIWLLEHFKALCEEYTLRYGKVHRSQSLWNDLKEGASYIPKGDLTPFANCAARSDMGIDYRHMEDVPEAYRLYIRQRWNSDKLPPKWTGRSTPNF